MNIVQTYEDPWKSGPYLPPDDRSVPGPVPGGVVFEKGTNMSIDNEADPKCQGSLTSSSAGGGLGDHAPLGSDQASPPQTQENVVKMNVDSSEEPKGPNRDESDNMRTLTAEELEIAGGNAGDLAELTLRSGDDPLVEGIREHVGPMVLNLYSRYFDKMMANRGHQYIRVAL